MPFDRLRDRTDLLPSIAIVVGGMMWGGIWLPLRALGEAGLPAAWPGAVLYMGTAVVLLPICVVRWRRIVAQWRVLAVCGLFTGAAFSFYSTSLILTEVVRSVLLFYLTPIWGTLLGLIVLGERLTPSRAIALAMAVTGLLVVLGIGEKVPWPQNTGDWLALLSGLAWAFGTLKLYQAGPIAIPEQIMSFIMGSMVVTMGSIALGGPTFGGLVEGELLIEMLPWGLLAALFILPMVWLTLWPSTVLTPGRIGLLLMSDVVVGVVSAAIWAGEPFGVREAVGAMLIVGAGVVEVLGGRQRA